MRKLLLLSACLSAGCALLPGPLSGAARSAAERSVSSSRESEERPGRADDRATEPADEPSARAVEPRSSEPAPRAEPSTESSRRAPARSAEADFDSELRTFKRKVSKDAREGFPKSCGIQVNGMKQDGLTLVLYDKPKKKKLFKKYEEPTLKTKDLAGKFDVYCDGRIVARFADGTSDTSYPMIDDSVEQRHKCESTCRATTAACRRYARGSSDYYTQCDRPCSVSCH